MDRYPINQTNPHSRYVKRAIEFLKAGEMIAYPTDVNYGIGCLLSSATGVKNLNNLTSRLSKNKLHTIICHDFSEISKYAVMPNDVFKVMKKILPGPYTIILEAKNLVPKIFQTKRKTIGVRLVNNPVTQSLLHGVDAPLMNFTALSYDKELIMEDPEEIEKKYFYSVAILLDIGEFPTRHTTVVDYTGDEPVVVRQGAGDYFVSLINSHVSL
ncbi:MAG: L-threonylcarbamoyladenylate synthase [Proteobacteria bacterium]|nr:L-threonylcarbamoyladenylate synthase [Pseudomonadota bacterium]